jgi:cytochrome c oxidase subunit II
MSPHLLSYGKRALAPALLAGAVYVTSPDQVTNIFKPLSTPADSVHRAALLSLAVCAAIFLTVAGLLIYAIVRFRCRPGYDASEPPQIYGSNQIELAWTVLPSASIATPSRALRPMELSDLT